MNQGRTVFSQLVEFLPTYQFQICVDRYQGNRYVKDFSCWDQFLLFGVCSAHLSRKSSRYRSLSSCSATQALSYGLPGTGFSQHVGTRQRTPRLADLCRFRSSSNCRRSRPLPPRAFRRGVVRDGVCPRLDDHRFVPFTFPVGKIPPPQERGETAHAAGSTGRRFLFVKPCSPFTMATTILPLKNGPRRSTLRFRPGAGRGRGRRWARGSPGTRGGIRDSLPMKDMPRRRNLWVTDTLQWAPEARLAQPANPMWDSAASAFPVRSQLPFELVCPLR